MKKHAPLLFLSIILILCLHAGSDAAEPGQRQTFEYATITDGQDGTTPI